MDVPSKQRSFNNMDSAHRIWTFSNKVHPMNAYFPIVSFSPSYSKDSMDPFFDALSAMVETLLEIRNVLSIGGTYTSSDVPSDFVFRRAPPSESYFQSPVADTFLITIDSRVEHSSKADRTSPLNVSGSSTSVNAVFENTFSPNVVRFCPTFIKRKDVEFAKAPFPILFTGSISALINDVQSAKEPDPIVAFPSAPSNINSFIAMFPLNA